MTEEAEAGERTSFVAEPGRLDAVVAARLDLPRSEAQRLVAGGRVSVDGKARPKSHRLGGGERVEVEVSARSEVAPEPGPLPVLYQDDHLLVVSKPAGLVTHPTASRRTGTLVNRLLALSVPLASAGGPDRPGIVHRLDAGTSGAIVVAKDDRTHAALTDMFRRHAVDRRYLALVRGAVEPDRFLVEAPLGRRADRILVRAVTGKEAATEIAVRERLEGSALVEARPRTGRTHQIRVHLAAIGHPVLGDRAYGGAGTDASRLGLTRPFLHSWRIAFDHPITRERVEVEDPLPQDLEAALGRARAET
ncbi:MAG: RluA family pseudouridine synthase [Actinobacteria bacterium]|nr:MAG: RluA family pseudouridine synthase [Actinomycetota bacterium]